MANYTLDMDKYRALARQVAAESCVLLKNDHQTLPVAKGSKVSVFGRIALHYYKSGTGSGGLVNVKRVVGILDALKETEDILLNEKLADVYEAWVKDHPFDKGAGWGQEPWSQEEMPLMDELVSEAAKESELAIVVIGRTAGEDQDAKAIPGSYLLTEAEEEMLRKVCGAFEKVAVLLNVGNIIDMKWVQKYNPSAVMYVWQGGQEGGSGVVDVLSGKVSPCGKLSDTIAGDIEDYPSTKNFGDAKENLYQEDIYVGYRYFETFAKDKVLYPFGFGLSYTGFQVETKSFQEKEDAVYAQVEVINTGDFAGKEVVQLYVSAPQGTLGKPARELKAYEKTNRLLPGEACTLTFCVSKADMASYDDGGYTGYKSCYVLEAGRYGIYIGTDVRSAGLAGTFEVKETVITDRLQEAMAPVQEFTRFKPQADGEGYRLDYEAVPRRTINPIDKIVKRRPVDIPYSGDQGYQLGDVYENRISMETFLAQLSDEDLACIVRGEGMCSPKVTPGTAAAFGGVTQQLKKFGIPVGCCADGPSGIRMDCGTRAFSLPNGTALGCTYNMPLVEELYQMEGMELRKNKVDTLLGPGINIHRNPLNGRNFEYISEDPYLTGTMAAAQIKGMGYANVTGTIKHYTANNQEFHRHDCNSVVSERALREIYLKGYEIAVKDGGAYSIMTTYGAVNGIWTAGNYDLVTAILRDEWGFDGIVMTDWWAKMNEEGEDPSIKNTGIMVRAQNDLFMVTSDSESNAANDNSVESLAEGKTTRGEYQRCAGNICRMLMRSPVMDRFLGKTPEDDLVVIGNEDDEDEEVKNIVYHTVGSDTNLDMSAVNTDRGNSEIFGIQMKEPGLYGLSAKMRSGADAPELSQLSMSVFVDNQLKGTFQINGSDKEWTNQSLDLGFVMGNHYIKLYFSVSGMELASLQIEKTGEMKMPF